MSAQQKIAKLPPRQTPDGVEDRSAANNGSLIERMQSLGGLVNPLNLHFAGVAALAIVCVYLLIRVGVLWQTANSQNADALANQRALLQATEISARPLEGLDVKLKRSSDEADQFYRERLPVSYSEIATQLGALARRDNVKLKTVQYSPKAVSGQAGHQLSEVQMDAGLSGDYRSLVTFINGLERSHQFFVVQNISLTGQQTGQVNLRLRLTTYLRGVPPVELEKDVNAEPTDGNGAQADLAAAEAKQAKAAAGGTR